MIKLWLVFVVFVILTHFSIVAWRSLSGKEQWALTKTIGYSIIVVLLAMLAMALLVFLF
jgi:hypothetical protein